MGEFGSGNGDGFLCLRRGHSYDTTSELKARPFNKAAAETSLGMSMGQVVSGTYVPWAYEHFSSEKGEGSPGNPLHLHCQDRAAQPQVRVGAEGGGISLAGTGWDQRALDIAQEFLPVMLMSLEKYPYSSPTLTDIEDITTTYQGRLAEAEATGSIPVNIYLNLSSIEIGLASCTVLTMSLNTCLRFLAQRREGLPNPRRTLYL
ncbi:neural cell adhesion molecule 1 [Striga asiatica]|uniref:Neural cell adhesion molecule 1 n=1 Tax=Striga asiatica TaxID=4170 RepID=A0A5A7RFI6_STRAF|nr:neural cell adhesion molecule 1 [Striga asiatica]